MTLTQSDGFNASDTGLITALLTYHVLNVTLPAANITETPAFVPTLLTDAAYTNVTGGQVVGARLVDGNATVISGAGSTSNVVTADVAVSNGVVHIIDTVLTLPGAISDTALAGGLTALVGALNATELVETVDTTPNITVFAPVNTAFEDIGSILGDLSTADAATLLQYHVVPALAYSSLVANGTNATSLSGALLNFTVDGGELFVNSARVIAADILVANGVVHLIDAVLNPNSTVAADPNSNEPVVAFEGASSAAVPFTEGVATATSTISIATTDAVVAGNTPAPTDALSPSTTSSAGAARITGAVGAAALFGGAAFLAQM